MSKNQIDSIIEEFFPSIPELETSKKYWFFRTEGGRYYHDFTKNKFIAIGYDLITLRAIEEAHKSGNTFTLANSIRTLHKTKKHLLAANQLLKFTFEMKAGDIVIIPGHNSAILAIGQIVEDKIYTTKKRSDNVDYPCQYEKRRKIKWIKTIHRTALDSGLYKIAYTHQTITDISEAAEKIDRNIFDCYIKGESAHLVLKVKTESSITLKDLSDLLDNLNLIYSQYFDEKESPLEIQLQLESPGFVKVNSTTIKGIILLGIVLSSCSSNNENSEKLNKRLGEKLPEIRQSMDSLKTKVDALEVSGSKEVEKILNSEKDGSEN